MNKKHIISGLLVFAVILGWNVFLIQRDKKLYDTYHHPNSIENLKKPPTAEIR